MAASSEGRPVDGPYTGLERAASYGSSTQPYLTTGNYQPSEPPLPAPQIQRDIANINGTHPPSLTLNTPANGGNINTSSTFRDKSDSRETALTRKDSPSLRERSRGRTGTTRMCGKCGGQLSGQFVRALGDTFHLECFTCNVSPYHLISHKCPFLDVDADKLLGLWQNCCFEILSNT